MSTGAYSSPSMSQTIEYPLHSYSFMAIDVDYILAWLRSEEFKARRPTAVSQPTAMSAGTFQIPMIVNNSGSGMLIVAPNNPLGAGGSFTESFVISYYDSTFSSTTGT